MDLYPAPRGAAPEAGQAGLAIAMEETMSQPGFYQAERVGDLYPPDVARAARLGREAGLPAGREDDPQVLLLLVDAQVDFVHSDGALSVPGAVDDTRRLIEWLFDHTAQISAIAASLDSHLPLQIFYPTWWRDPEGEHPPPNTAITADQVDAGRWRPVYEPDWSVHYVHALQEQAKKDLMIWPFHTMLGTPGHAITPALYEAIAYHSAARQSQPKVLTKGTIAKTEYYSLLEPEVKVPEDPRGTLNREFLHEILSHDRVYLAGQAKSHCVLETVTSIMRYHGDEPEIVEKLRLLDDCTSSVPHPEIDFEAMANESLSEFQKRGLRIVSVEDPID